MVQPLNRIIGVSASLSWLATEPDARQIPLPSLVSCHSLQVQVSSQPSLLLYSIFFSLWWPLQPQPVLEDQVMTLHKDDHTPFIPKAHIPHSCSWVCVDWLPPGVPEALLKRPPCQPVPGQPFGLHASHQRVSSNFLSCMNLTRMQSNILSCSVQPLFEIVIFLNVIFRDKANIWFSL